MKNETLETVYSLFLGWLGSRWPARRRHLKPERFAKEAELSLKQAQEVFDLAVERGVLERFRDVECPVCGQLVVLRDSTTHDMLIDCGKGHEFELEDAQRNEVVYRATPPYMRSTESV